ncbi:MAG: hypothetical protein KF802_13060 [Bdellovibrionaceae bacterium]|nr:hypothetical protein [Pseudobdellovibrionaceae bacterium]
MNKIFGAFVLAASFCFMSCSGEETLSEKVSVSVKPESPVVYNHKIYVNGEPVEGPWFEFDFYVQNKSDKTLVVTNLLITVKRGGAADQQESDEASVSPSEFDTSVSLPNDEVLTCKYHDLGQYPPNQASPMRLYLDNGVNNCPSGFFRTVIGNLTKPPAGSRNYTYRAKMQAIGYFADPNTGERLDRFQQETIVYTK